MNLRMLPDFTLCFWCVRLTAAAQTNPAPAIPHLEKRGTATQLIVDGGPFLVLGGELR
jgi:type II secretory pathway component GspD/PulD (secretin)